MALGGSPVARERRLRAELRLAREEAGLTQKDVADNFGWHPSKVIRIEAGAVSIDVADLMALLQHYKVTDQAKIDELVAAARAGKEHVWWDDYRKDYPDLITYISYEASALRLRQFQSLVIPGILQTPEYARAIMQVYSSDTGVVARGVELRLARQRVLDRTDPPQEMFFIIDEAAIRRQIGGADVMTGQLKRLQELAKRPNISIQVVPFSVGGYRAMNGSFAIFEFPADEEDFVVFAEQTLRNVPIKAPEETSRYVETFFDLEQVALPDDEFGQFVDSVLSEM